MVDPRKEMEILKSLRKKFKTGSAVETNRQHVTELIAQTTQAFNVIKGTQTLIADLYSAFDDVRKAIEREAVAVRDLEGGPIDHLLNEELKKAIGDVATDDNFIGALERISANENPLRRLGLLTALLGEIKAGSAGLDLKITKLNERMQLDKVKTAERDTAHEMLEKLVYMQEQIQERVRTVERRYFDEKQKLERNLKVLTAKFNNIKEGK